MKVLDDIQPGDVVRCTKMTRERFRLECGEFIRYYRTRRGHWWLSFKNAISGNTTSVNLYSWSYEIL